MSFSTVLAMVLLSTTFYFPVQDKKESVVKGTIEGGPFRPSYESLKQYKCPEWFRDAKFGIWAHWSAQCVPEQGDWYARGMYQEGSAQYKYHVENYGHPSKFGFKDICNLWKAENWDPEKLIKLYKRAGAKYFVALANHHCNFDCWNSKCQSWNVMNVGPKKDIVGTWAKVARKNGLKFGVTVHCARSWEWFEVSRDSDKSGPMKGVQYDGALTKADGKGLWWDGLDPAELYCVPHAPGTPPDSAYVNKWFNRVKDLIDQYDPDLLYFDDWMLPLGDAGLKIGAHYYNANIKRHGGKLEAVLNTKGLPPDLRKTMVLDIERGLSGNIEPYPWQTDTCIGEWHYHRGIKYQTAANVIPMLCDIVAKNGNLLLNIPVRGDGTIDDDEVEFLEEMAAWMPINGEAIFGTRPWKVSGEGPKFTGGSDNREVNGAVTPIRFTTKRGGLYAIALGWPSGGKLVVRSLAGAKVTGVKLLGHKGALHFSQGADGLAIDLPADKPCKYAYAFKLSGAGLMEFEPVRPDTTIAVGKSAVLAADRAEPHGNVQVENRIGTPNIGFWDDASDWVSWDVRFDAAGTYELVALCSSPHGDVSYAIELGGSRLTAGAKKTASFEDYTTGLSGKVVISKAGKYTLKVMPADKAKWRPINLIGLTIEKVK